MRGEEVGEKINIYLNAYGYPQARRRCITRRPPLTTISFLFFASLHNLLQAMHVNSHVSIAVLQEFQTTFTGRTFAPSRLGCFQLFHVLLESFVFALARVDRIGSALVLVDKLFDLRLDKKKIPLTCVDCIARALLVLHKLFDLRLDTFLIA